ncbi:MAG TPA: MaoC family dehydratase [Stackebrandtia sp.]|jgi:acyl dehydratase|uniref:MaoC family dehydratase n=1 Tax=Stackebrandtia sp. TaxID=2023065 RepID=UPI002D261DAD|nr:MaoC family dehydratase [Stackebrandtia sp.]HZE39330.1 MaoC family dehydratase [Stackebrandtia sp.]
MMDTSSPPVRPKNLDDLTALVGVELGPTAWHHVTQDAIDAFAQVTGDHQWIHTDPKRAADSPLRGTIAHGLYSLSLGPALSAELLLFDGFAHGLNYGYDKVRFPAPVPVGSRIRMRATVTAADHVPGGIQVTSRQLFECDAAAKPVVVAVSVARVVER